MKRQRSNNGVDNSAEMVMEKEKKKKTDVAAAGKSTRSKVGTEPADHGGGPTPSKSGSATATWAVDAVETEYCYLYNGGDHQGVLLDYEEMWWSSTWLPIFDVEYYLADDRDAAAAAAAAGGVLWDIDDIWNLKSIN